MGCWLNPGNILFRQVVENSELYVDKTGMLAVLNGWLNSEKRFVCVSRARRFGKSTAADMIAAYYDKTCDSHALFEHLYIAKEPSFETGLNQYSVLYFDAQEFMEEADPEAFLADIQRRIMADIRNHWPECKDAEKQSIVGYLTYLNDRYNEQFVIIIDEWDCIFRHQFPDRIQRQYVDFLRQLFKSTNTKKFCALAYLTGIFPIVKYNTESAMNLFYEYTMIDSGPLSPFVGFTLDEVTELCEKFHMSLDECRKWYDGYKLADFEHIYNPNAIYRCMTSGKYKSYWTSTGSYEQISNHITMNFDGLKDDIARLLAGEHVDVNTRHFSNRMDDLKSRNDVLTLLIHLGYLGYDTDTGKCFIPNTEIHMEFETALEVCGWEGFVEAWKRSKDLMKALIQKDAKTVAAEIQKVHDSLSSMMTYKNESDLAITIVYACAAGRKDYLFARELPTGGGFADIVMIPTKPNMPAIVMELKWKRSVNGALKQIKENRYCAFLGDYRGPVLLCGINYSSRSGKHTCKIEEIDKTNN